MKPNVEQLATLAARLKRSSKETPQELIFEALTLWLAAAEALHKPAVPVEPKKPSWKQPKAYPVTLDEFLLLTLPKMTGKTADRMAAFRRWQMSTGKDIDAAAVAIGHWRANPIGTADAFNSWAATFTEWQEAYQKRTTSEARRAAARKKRKARPNREAFRRAIEGDQLT